MAMFEITCIQIQPGNGKETHEDISGLGGKAWHAPRDAVISDIETARNTYYVRKDGRNFLVAVAVGPEGKYLRGRSDGAWNDLLLELPACVSVRPAA